VKINYITGPQGCGKTTHLEIVANKAQRKGLAVVRPRITSSGFQGLQADLRRVTPKTVVLIDEGEGCGLPIQYDQLQLPHGVQVFVANQGPRNTWANLS
jgi:Holliday junction resolvasome RuvABC ATP-dependent DNA helicase subunit